ncbi:MAG TPA: LacI family DNA-binding transcriptional regulator [Segetibacter sp.]
MSGKRITIYHIAEELGLSGSYVSRALNNHPAVSDKIKELVKNKARELNYRHNSHAANLRQGSSKTIGVIVPHINQSFFSEAIAGIEEACFENNHSLIICQSHESYKQECLAIETLIHQNVDCILISISGETTSSAFLEEVTNHNIELIQFDRCLENVGGFKVLNDNKDASCKAVNILIKEGYKRIAFIGGPDHLAVFNNRKEGYLQAVKKAGLKIPCSYIIDNALSKEEAIKAARKLLALEEPPDAFFTVSDLQSLGVLQVANSMNIKVPKQLGIFGFANEAFTELIIPALSSIDQKSKQLGKCAANLYFENISAEKVATETSPNKIIKSEIIERESSRRSDVP